ncbi:DUF4136 domain-containing protein [Rufibacter quisquiliarum]|uniref:DUF4136 domain-containing protein n=1 Tax=Rufibacter quisquiliarum TaxID=1549639 RepID=A0A839GR74_9BACT|nr:DUF4136 domain-containing protein [Rufibacter quisquiliarum]MBA9077387.1 hypothetical protein [Rufibacter quisquiliarum]
MARYWWKVMWLCVVLLISCNAVRVSNKEAADDFRLASYKTFDFQSDATAETAAFEQEFGLLRNEVAKQLQKRGLRQSSGQPDLLVNIGAMISEKTQTRETRFGQDGPYYTGQRRYTWKSQEVPVGTYQEGTVSVHLVDRVKNELVWRADAAAVIPNKKEKLEERIREGVEEMFKEIQ